MECLEKVFLFRQVLKPDGFMDAVPGGDLRQI